MKRWMGLIVTGGVVSAAALAMMACSSSSSNASSGGGGGGGVNCESVGYKACPNDAPYTQADIDACNKCNSQLQALASCQGASVCSSAGVSTTAPGAPACASQTTAVTSCILGTPSDAGTGGD